MKYFFKEEKGLGEISPKKSKRRVYGGGGGGAVGGGH